MSECHDFSLLRDVDESRI